VDVGRVNNIESRIGGVYNREKDAARGAAEQRAADADVERDLVHRTESFHSVLCIGPHWRKVGRCERNILLNFTASAGRESSTSDVSLIGWFDRKPTKLLTTHSRIVSRTFQLLQQLRITRKMMFQRMIRSKKE
jgi:hypothetical protein